MLFPSAFERCWKMDCAFYIHFHGNKLNPKSYMGTLSLNSLKERTTNRTSKSEYCILLTYKRGFALLIHMFLVITEIESIKKIVLNIKHVYWRPLFE